MQWILWNIFLSEVELLKNSHLFEIDCIEWKIIIITIAKIVAEIHFFPIASQPIMLWIVDRIWFSFTSLTEENQPFFIYRMTCEWSESHKTQLERIDDFGSCYTENIKCRYPSTAELWNIDVFFYFSEVYTAAAFLWFKWNSNGK